MTFVLHALTGELSGQDVEVRTPLTVGRAEDCDLVLEERRLSRHHARFSLEGEHWFVEDLGSPNGTFVNQRRVTKAVLHPGDTVSMCKTTFKVGGGDAAPSADSQEPVPELVKAPHSALPPDLESMLAEDYFAALGLHEETLHDGESNPLATVLAKTRNFALLHEVTKAMQRQHDPQSMLTSVLSVVLKVTGAERGYVILVEPDGTQVVPVQVGTHCDGPATISQTVAQYVLRDRSSVLCLDAGADERFAQAESLFLQQTRALIAAPMLLQDQVLGALVLQSSHLAQRFTESDLDLLSVVASTVGVGLENLRLAEKRERTIAELEQAQAQLLATQQRLIQAEQMAALGRLASGIAHEVKNHLSPFMLATMIAKKYPEDAEIQDSAEIMLEAQQHILDLVNEVRAFAQGNQREHRPEPMDLAHVVQGILRFVRCDKALERARVELEAEAEPIVVLDPARFRQVLINLLRNAADAVPKDKRPHIRIRILEHQGHAYLDVIDNGRGIPEELADEVFTPFFSTKGEAGLGLGLDISRNIIRQHGGELGFSSQPGEGTTFRLRLPLADAEKALEPPA